MKIPEGLGCCPSRGTPFPCASSSVRASIATSLWRSLPLLADIQVPQGLRPPKYTTVQGRPPQARRHQVVAKNLFPSQGPRSQAASLLPPCWRGPFPARDQQQPRQRRQEAKPLLMLFCGAPVRPPSATRLFRAPGPPPSARAQCLTRGRGSDSCQRRRRWRRPSVFAEEKPETDPLALPLPFPVQTFFSLDSPGVSSLRRAVLHSEALFVARPGGK